MSASTRSLIPRALCLGIAGGFRSWPPFAALALQYDEAPAKGGWRRWPVFRSEWGRGLLIALGAGEFVTDKLPGTQSRLAPTTQWSRLDGGLFFRVAFSGLAGAALGTEYRGRHSVLTGATLGVVGSILGNYGGYHARKAAVEATDLPDPVVAVVEDLATIALLVAVFRDR